jgi:nitronate monooxygenase
MELSGTTIDGAWSGLRGLHARDRARPTCRATTSSSTFLAVSAIWCAAWRSSATTDRRFGVALPIVQAPMAGVQGSALAIAVCNAGGLGTLPCAMLDAAAMRRELEALRAGTSAPFAVNFFSHVPPTPDSERERRWRDRLAPYYAELGLDPSQSVAAAARVPFGDEAADVLDDFEPAIVSFHFGLPPSNLLARVRRRGAAVWATATTVDEARWLESRGVDAIVAQGIEAGGHRGNFLSDDLTLQAPTRDLVARLVATTKVPVIAAGGIADASAVAAVVDLGAAAAMVGTAYMLCPEATTNAVHRAALGGDGARRETALTNLFSGRPARGIVNRLMRELGPISDLPPAFPLAASALAPLRAAAERRGSGDFSPLWAGESGVQLQELPAAVLTRELASRI